MLTNPTPPPPASQPTPATTAPSSSGTNSVNQGIPRAPMASQSSSGFTHDQEIVPAESYNEVVKVSEPADRLDPLSHLGSIFDKIRKQVIEWGEDANWKIDVFLLPNEEAVSTNGGAVIMLRLLLFIMAHTLTKTLLLVIIPRIMVRHHILLGRMLGHWHKLTEVRWLVLDESCQRGTARQQNTVLKTGSLGMSVIRRTGFDFVETLMFSVYISDRDVGFELQPPPNDLPLASDDSNLSSLNDGDISALTETGAKKMLSMAARQLREQQLALNQTLRHLEAVQRHSAQRRVDDQEYPLIRKSKQVEQSSRKDCDRPGHRHRHRHVHYHRHHHRHISISRRGDTFASGAHSLDNLATLATQVLFKEPLILAKKAHIPVKRQLDLMEEEDAALAEDIDPQEGSGDMDPDQMDWDGEVEKDEGLKLKSVVIEIDDSGSEEDRTGRGDSSKESKPSNSILTVHQQLYQQRPPTLAKLPPSSSTHLPASSGPVKGSSHNLNPASSSGSSRSPFVNEANQGFGRDSRQPNKQRRV
ncbi:hypothetical protein BGZ83_002489 [Gryganskiella cystojenkinii]|nr:hypothetical protein BGZ83_002489 [Gryganskiella cystojenkinii]